MRVPTGMEAFARTTTLPRSRTPIFYYDAGPEEGPTLLLIHGLGDEADTWRFVIEPLSKSYRVIAPDLPGFGRSALPAGLLFTPPFFSRVLALLLASLHVTKATVVGSSLGASIAQLLALKEPRLVERLVLVDGGMLSRGRLPPSLLTMLIPGLGERRYKSLGHDLDAAYASLQPYYAALGALPATQRAFLRARVAERVASATQRKAYFAALRGYIGWMFLKGRSVRNAVAGLEIPTTFIWGAEDRIVPVSVGETAYERSRQARLERIAGAGHLPHQETPSEFLEALLTDQAHRRTA